MKTVSTFASSAFKAISQVTEDLVSVVRVPASSVKTVTTQVLLRCHEKVNWYTFVNFNC